MMTETLRDMLIRHEGFRAKPYHCPEGKLTIGVGRNLEDVGLTADEVHYMLTNDITKTIAELQLYKWFDGLSRNRQNALIDMHFNLGSARFRGFQLMLNALSRGDFDTAAREMIDSKWAQQVPARARELAEMVKRG